MNNKITVTVRGDSGTDYPLEIFLGRKLLHLKCGCRAGMAGSRCKHAADILQGDFSRIEDEGERAAAQELMDRISLKVDVLAEVDGRLAAVERQIKALNEQKKKIKAEFDVYYKTGFPLLYDPEQP